MKILNNTKKFGYLAFESFTSFDYYIKKLKFEFTLALLSRFLSKVIFVIFERKSELKSVI